MWLALKAIGSGIFGVLKLIPWQAWAIAAALFGAYRWHSSEVDKAVAHNVYEQVYAVRLQWLAETMREDEEALSERAKWQAFIAERDAAAAKFKADLAAESEAKQKARAAERRAVAALNEEVARDVRNNPMPAICTLSDDAYRMRTEQICAANKAAGRPCGGAGEAGAGRLPRSGQGAPWWPVVTYWAPHG